MNVLVIPDVHLKPWMFDRADMLMRLGTADRVVCLMDIADDWDKEMMLDLYKLTYDRAIEFAKKYPDTLWCFGNHDACYMWNERETGYSNFASSLVVRKLYELTDALPSEEQLRYVHRIDNVIFCHGGLSQYFVDLYASDATEVDDVLEAINGLWHNELWEDASPLWHRPQYSSAHMYKDDSMIQVVGHTPMNKIEKKGNVISCDVFSTYSNGDPIGTQEFLVIDTKTGEFKGVK